MVIFNKVTLNPFTSRLASYGEIICHYLLPVLIKTYSVTIQMEPLHQYFYMVLFTSYDFTKRNLGFWMIFWATKKLIKNSVLNPLSSSIHKQIL